MISTKNTNVSNKTIIKNISVNGNGNVIGPIISGNNNIVDNDNTVTDNNPNIIQYQYKTKGNPIKRKNVQKAKKASALLAIISLIADLIALGTFIQSFFNGKLLELPKSFWVPVIQIGSITLALSIGVFILTQTVLNPKQIARINLLLFDIFFKSIDDECIYRIKLFGICPICGGNVRVSYIKYKFNDTVIKEELEGRCLDNPSQHKFRFDPTTLTGKLIED